MANGELVAIADVNEAASDRVAGLTSIAQHEKK